MLSKMGQKFAVSLKNVAIAKNLYVVKSIANALIQKYHALTLANVQIAAIEMTLSL